MDDNVNQVFQQASVFQKMWTDAFADMAQVWTRYSPAQPPPDAMKEMRSGMLKVMTQTWDDFVRSPQFLEYMKQGMDGAMDFKKLSADFMTRAHHNGESPAREDIDGILLAIRHMERRLLDRVEEVDLNVAALDRRLDTIEAVAREPVSTGSAPASKPSRVKAAAKPAPVPPAASRKAVPRKAAVRRKSPKS